MDIAEAIVGRRSVREYTREAVPEQTVLRLLEAANAAPSASNSQCWEFVIVRRDTLDRLEHLLESSFVERAAEAGEKMVRAVETLPIPVVANESKMDGLRRFYRTLGGAPVVVMVLTGRSSDPWTMKNNLAQSGAAIQNLMLMAHGLGLGTCWLTGPLKKGEAGLREMLKIDDDKEIVGLITVGVPSRTPQAPPKTGAAEKTSVIGPDLEWRRLSCT